MLLSWFRSGVEAGVRAGFGCFDWVANSALRGVVPKSVGSAEKYECRRKVSDRQRSAGSIGMLGTTGHDGYKTPVWSGATRYRRYRL